MFPHPLVRLLLLILLAASLPAFDARVLLLLLALILLASLQAPEADWRRVLRASYRLRWLLLSIFVLHLGFAPDRVAAFGGSLWLPAPAAVEEAVSRALLLVVLLAGVELLRQTTPTGEVAASVVGLLKPFRLVGWDPQRFATRLALTLEAVPRTGRLLRDFTRNRRLRPRNLTAWAQAAAELVQATEREAGAAGEAGCAGLPALPAMQRRDWLVLGAGAAALMLLRAV